MKQALEKLGWTSPRERCSDSAHEGEQITPQRLFELHRMVTEGTLDNADAAGRLQTAEDQRVSVWSPEGLLLHEPPPADELGVRLERLCRFANGEDDGAYVPPVLRAIAVHFMFGYDHYFEDGNVRTARAVFYWVILREGFWLTEFVTVSKLPRAAPTKYARSYLLTESDAGDLTHFFIYHLGIINRAIQGLRHYLEMKARELTHLKAVVSDRHAEFNHRQLALLEHALRRADSAYTVHSHSMSHQVSGETARKDLRTWRREDFSSAAAEENTSRGSQLWISLIGYGTSRPDRTLAPGDSRW